MRISTVLLILGALGCAGKTRERATLGDSFMAAFEQVQSGGSEHTVMLLSTVDDKGQVTIYGAAPEPMDRMAHIWGPDHPAVPIFFSPIMAATFSILESSAVRAENLSEEEAEAWAWKALREPKDDEARR
jgi:hypothetical protein